MPITIGPSTIADSNAVRAVHRACFPSPLEARLVDALRAAGRLSISLVARDDDVVVGHVALSPVSPGNGLGLAPVAVRAEHRRQGVAARLIESALAIAASSGCAYVVVLGAPAYYRRFGFDPASRHGLACVFGGGDAFQVRRLADRELPPPGTLVSYAPEFALFESGEPADEAPAPLVEPAPNGDASSLRPPRAVILGASNVTRGAATVAATAGRLCGVPLELLVAAGRGRSYGCWSRVLARGLPPIVDCGIWAWLEQGPPPTHALVTDVGNDIMYGHEPQRILGWVDTCVARLRAMGAAVTISRLAMARLERLSPRTYEIARMVIVPQHPRVPFRDAIARIAAVDQGLAAIAASHGATVVVPSGAWYGIDPIHVRGARRAEAWRALMASWARDAGAPPVGGSPLAAARLAATLPQCGTMFGARFGRPDGEPGTVRAGQVVVRLF